MSASSEWAGLELRHLITLEAIAKHRSFRKAATCLNYTQSGISQQVAVLERIVGEQLIERPGGSRPVGLTEAGEIVLRHAEAVFHEITAAHADVAALTGAAGGSLRVGAFQSVSATLVPEILRRLPDEHPTLSVEFVPTTSDDDLFALLEDGRLDMTFAMLPVPPGPFESVELFADRFVVIVAADSDLADRNEPLSLRELAEHPLAAAHDCRYVSLVETQMRELGYTPDVIHRTDDNGTLQGLVADGSCVAVVGRLVVDSVGGNVVVLELEEALPPRRIALAWRKDRDFLPRHEAFLEVVHAVCEDRGLTSRPARAA